MNIGVRLFRINKLGSEVSGPALLAFGPFWLLWPLGRFVAFESSLYIPLRPLARLDATPTHLQCPAQPTGDSPPRPHFISAREAWSTRTACCGGLRMYPASSCRRRTGKRNLSFLSFPLEGTSQSCGFNGKMFVSDQLRSSLGRVPPNAGFAMLCIWGQR